MFRIRRINESVLPSEKSELAQVQAILREQFPGIDPEDVLQLSDELRDPMRYRYRTMVFTATGGHGRVKGFAILLHLPDLHFCYLDYISAARLVVGRGVGGALYARVREESLALGSVGLFFECLPDEPALCKAPEVLRANASRLNFYDRYGARPIVGTKYETPLKPDADCPPYLVFDDLGSGKDLPRDTAREIVRAILERKYGSRCPPGYIDMVVDSFRDDPVRLRAPRPGHREAAVPVQPVPSLEKKIALVVNDKHEIHHVRERGYVESPVRVGAILQELERTGLFERLEPRHFGSEHVRAVHEPGFVDYLKRVCATLEPGESVYPYVFPIRNRARPPWDLPTRAGYYCIDTFTPLNRNAWLSARRGVDCALTAADSLLEGRRIAYALVRPPGHHAERRSFGGFCYLNSAAIAAHYLSRHGRVAVLDVDYHHGNGTQDVFYRRSDVLTVSIHGHPHFAYPYFSGYRDETGEDEGAGYNVNLALPERVDGAHYDKALEEAMRHVARFQPRFLVVALGLDTARGDPTGSWSLRPADFERNGRRIARCDRPTLIVQEGGYNTRSLGPAARSFFVGLSDGRQMTIPPPSSPPGSPPAAPAPPSKNHVPKA